MSASTAAPPNGKLQAPGTTDASFRKLVAWTYGLTVFLIFIGGVVRVSDSGLGCGPAGSGLEGWPLCNGRLVPGLDMNHIIEYTHRITAAAVGVLILLIAWQAYTRYRDVRLIWPLALTALGLVLVQGGLGGLTVENNLHEFLVAAHLAMAMLFLGVLIAMFRASRGTVPTPPRSPGGLRRLSWAASLLVLATIVAGGYMSGTQKYGTPTYEGGDGAHLACGKEFPACNGGLFPFGQARLVDVHLVHRAIMYVTVAVLLLLLFKLMRGPATGWQRRLAVATLATLGIQVLVGALNVWLGEHRELILAHLVLGTVLWALAISLTLSLVTLRADGPLEEAGTRPPAV